MHFLGRDLVLLGAPSLIKQEGTKPMLTSKDIVYFSTHLAEYKYNTFTNELYQLDSLIHCWVPTEFSAVPIAVAAHFHGIGRGLIE